MNGVEHFQVSNNVASMFFTQRRIQLPETPTTDMGITHSL